MSVAAPADAAPQQAGVQGFTERGEDSATIGLNRKLAEVFKVLDDIAQDKAHGQGWGYTSANAIYRAVRNLLRDRNLLLVPSVSGPPVERPYKTSNGADRIVTTVPMTFTFTDADTGEELTCDWYGAGADDAEKGLSKAMTVAERTFLKGFFLLPDVDEQFSGGGSRGRQAAGRNGQGEEMATRQQLDSIMAAADGRMSALVFLNFILAGRGSEPVDCDEDAAMKQWPEQIKHLTRAQAREVLQKITEAVSE